MSDARHHHGPHSHDDAHGGHGHSHGLIDPSIKRSREGLIAVRALTRRLGATAVAQLVIFIASGSVALLADLIHNFGDAATAIPLAIAFLLRSERAEGYAGLFVVAAIFISACVAGVESVSRLIHPHAPTHLEALAAAGVVGFAGNWIAAGIRTRAGRRLDSGSLGRGRQPCARRLLCLAGRGCRRRRRRDRGARCRPADRPRHNGGHPQDHMGLLGDGSRRHGTRIGHRSPPLSEVPPAGVGHRLKTESDRQATAPCPDLRTRPQVSRIVPVPCHPSASSEISSPFVLPVALMSRSLVGAIAYASRDRGIHRASFVRVGPFLCSSMTSRTSLAAPAPAVTSLRSRRSPYRASPTRAARSRQRRSESFTAVYVLPASGYWVVAPRSACRRISDGLVRCSLQHQARGTRQRTKRG